MIETHFCSIRGCARPANTRLDQSFESIVLRLWLCEQHENRSSQDGELEIDHSRTSWLLKSAI